MTLYLVLRVVHIFSAALWLGAAVLAGWFLMPAVADAGPEGGKVMAQLQRRGFIAYVPVVATIAILTGIYLYWRYTGGFSSEVVRSASGMAYGHGGALALIAYILGSMIGPAIARARRLSEEAATMTDEARRGAVLARVGALRKRALLFTRIVSILLTLALVAMSIAVFI